MGALFAEHLPQTTLPHVRQWCLLTSMVKSMLQIMHMVTLPSGTQGGASSPSSICCELLGWHAIAPLAKLTFLWLYSSWALPMASIQSFLSAIVLETFKNQFCWLNITTGVKTYFALTVNPLTLLVILNSVGNVSAFTTDTLICWIGILYLTVRNLSLS